MVKVAESKAINLKSSNEMRRRQKHGRQKQRLLPHQKEMRLLVGALVAFFLSLLALLMFFTIRMAARVRGQVDHKRMLA
jgi:tmRNA-binding protein